MLKDVVNLVVSLVFILWFISILVLPHCFNIDDYTQKSSVFAFMAAFLIYCCTYYACLYISDYRRKERQLPELPTAA